VINVSQRRENMKLKCTGRVVELKMPTIAQRITCNDTKTIVQTAGGLTIEHAYESIVLWAAVGLGFSDIERLAGYTDNEIREVAEATQELTVPNTNKKPKSK